MAPSRCTFAVLALALTWPGPAAAELSTKTLAAFGDYMRAVETELSPRLTRPDEPLWAGGSSAGWERLKRGDILIAALGGGKPRAVPDGLVHDWAGAVFVPGARLQDALKLLQDYDRHKVIYKPEVMDSKLLRRDGNRFHTYLRLMKKKVITVVLDTEYDVSYSELTPARWVCRSVSTRIAEVSNAGTPDEREKPPGTGHGFLWRFNAYWWIAEKDGGVYLECRAISLTRDIPLALAWIIRPMVSGLPRESLSNTMRLSRDVLSARPTD